MKNDKSLQQLISVFIKSNTNFLREVAEFGNESNVMIYENALEDKIESEIIYCEARKHFLRHMFSIIDFGINEYTFEKDSPLVFKKHLIGELRDFHEMMQDHDVQEGGIYDDKDFEKIETILKALK